MPAPRRLLFAACALLPAACARVSRDAPPMRHIDLALGRIATPAQALATPPPAYPAALLGRGLPPVAIAAQLQIDGRGQVARVEVAGEADADADTRLFIGAVREAAQRWRFSPAGIVRYAADAEGHGHLVDSEHPAFRQDAVVVFEVCDGRPRNRVALKP